MARGFSTSAASDIAAMTARMRKVTMTGWSIGDLRRPATVAFLCGRTGACGSAREPHDHSSIESSPRWYPPALRSERCDSWIGKERDPQFPATLVGPLAYDSTGPDRQPGDQPGHEADAEGHDHRLRRVAADHPLGTLVALADLVAHLVGVPAGGIGRHRDGRGAA